MLKFGDWLKKNFNEELPTGEINGAWFAERNLPMVVSCACCDSTMALPSALIDDEGYTVCASCCDYD